MIDNSKVVWRRVWSQHIGVYLGTIPRQAYYLYFILEDTDRRILEIAAGSFRDTVRLNEWGYDCIGTDFLEEAVQAARVHYPLYERKMLCQDASQLSFKDKSFDVSFHNGFYILFENDASIGLLAREQVRVTKRCIISSVHNALNTRLQDLFKERAVSDPFYDVRFFDPHEITDLLRPYCETVKVFPFGDPLFDRLIRFVGRFPKLLKHLYSSMFPRMELAKCERLMVVGYLK